MKVEVLGSEPTDESVGHVAGGARIWIIGHEARQGFSILHAWHSAPFQLLLAEKRTDLSLINDSTFGSSLNHGGDHVFGKALDKAIWYAVFENFRSCLPHSRLHLVVKLNLELLSVSLALANLLLDLHPYWIFKCHALFLTGEGVLRNGHLRELLNFRVKVFLRLEHNSI